MSFVVDASVCLAWLIEAERSPATQALLPRLEAEGATAPSLWLFEVPNALLVAQRRGRFSTDSLRVLLEDLEGLEVAIDDQSDRAAFGSTLDLASRHNLTVYDAAYLELARRRALPLATLDVRLRRAAQAEAVVQLPATVPAAS